MKQNAIDDAKLAKTASRFAALGSEQRLAVLRCLVRAGDEGLTIGELGARTGITGATLTHHMKTLAQAELVRQTKSGRTIICVAVDYDEIVELADFLLKNCCADAPVPAKDHRHD